VTEPYPSLDFILLPDVYPQVIFLDAVGTLFGVRGSVGAIYGAIAREFGVDLADEAIDQSFYRSFQASSPPTFPDVDPTDLPQQEFAWWRAIAAQTFAQVGALHQFPDFEAAFTVMFSHFATAEPWFIYPDVLPTLERWHDRGIELGIVSNFDSRLYPVLKELHLFPFFTSVTISTEAGAAKPDPQIFATALQKHRCTASTAWHIGDSYREDYETAQMAGLQAFWLKR
jgi:putative hydrolase of the HAD superfamily